MFLKTINPFFPSTVVFFSPQSSQSQLMCSFFPGDLSFGSFVNNSRLVLFLAKVFLLPFFVVGSLMLPLPTKKVICPFFSFWQPQTFEHKKKNCLKFLGQTWWYFPLRVNFPQILNWEDGLKAVEEETASTSPDRRGS